MGSFEKPGARQIFLQVNRFNLFFNFLSGPGRFVNSNMLITNIIGKSAQELCVSSTSASKFKFLELPIGTGSTQFESDGLLVSPSGPARIFSPDFSG